MGKKKSGGSLMARLGNGRLELLVGGFVGLLGGAMVMLMPIEALQDLVLKTGLPSILPPLDPPLGLKAQIGLAGIVAFAGFILVWGVMKLVDKAAFLFEESDEYEDDDEVEEVKPAKDAPRTRRRDHHPDAPTRAPVSATRDLGLPATAEAGDEEAAPRRFGLFNRKPAAAEAGEPDRGMPWRRNREAAEEDVPNARLRRFRAVAEAEAAAFEQPEAPVDLHEEAEVVAFEPVIEEPQLEAEVAIGQPEPIDLDAGWDEPAEPEFAPWAQAEAPAPVEAVESESPHDWPDFATAEPRFVAPQPVADAAPIIPEAPLPPVAEPVAVAAPEPAPEPAPAAFVPQWMVSAEPVPVPVPVPAPEPVAEAPAPVPDFRSETIADLVTRLEQAVARRIPSATAPIETPDVAPAPTSAPVDQWRPEPVAVEEEEEEFGADAMDTRLRSALANLKRFAPQG